MIVELQNNIARLHTGLLSGRAALDRSDDRPLVLRNAALLPSRRRHPVNGHPQIAALRFGLRLGTGLALPGLGLHLGRRAFHKGCGARQCDERDHEHSEKVSPHYDRLL